LACRSTAATPLISASAFAASFTLPLAAARAAEPAAHDVPEGEHTMGFVTTDDDVQIFYHYAADAFAVARALDLKNAVHIGQFHRWWRGGAVCGAPWRACGPGGQSRPRRRHSTADAEDRWQP
jgi:hypothetical protein